MQATVVWQHEAGRRGSWEGPRQAGRPGGWGGGRSSGHNPNIYSGSIYSKPPPMVAICSSRNVQSVLEAALNMCTAEGREVTRGESARRAGRGERVVRCCVCVCVRARCSLPCLGAFPSPLLPALHLRYAVQRPRAAQKGGGEKAHTCFKVTG